MTTINRRSTHPQTVMQAGVPRNGSNGRRIHHQNAAQAQSCAEHCRDLSCDVSSDCAVTLATDRQYMASHFYGQAVLSRPSQPIRTRRIASSSLVLKEKPMNIEDKLAIEELIALYNHSLDGGDYETWVDCWSEEAVMDGAGQYRVGIEAIRDFANTYEQNHRSQIPGLRHFTCNIISDITGNEATSRSFLQLTRTGANGVQIIFTGRYEDVLIKREGKWRFRGRKFIQDLSPAS